MCQKIVALLLDLISFYSTYCIRVIIVFTLSKSKVDLLPKLLTSLQHFRPFVRFR